MYVDHAGTTLYSKSQIEAHHKELLSNLYGNPHSRSQSSRLTTDAIDQIRYRYIICYTNIILISLLDSKNYGLLASTLWTFKADLNP